MADIIKRTKPLTVNPLKVGQPAGAALAFLGIQRAIPMLHGSQGCSALNKVFFVRHFHEPIPLQTTAMDQVSTVMNADENVLEGLKTLAEKNQPLLIGLPTTGLSETQGTDIHRLVKTFYTTYPQFQHIPVIAVNTPDYLGCLESGFALAVKALLEYLVPEGTQASGHRPQQVNVLVGTMLTPGDLEHLKELIEAFGLHPLIVPDLSDSLDGHLTDLEFTPLTVGGTQVSDFCKLGESIATLVIGRSLNEAAEVLKKRTGVANFHFDTLMGLAAVDRLVMTLAELSQQPVPEKIERQRAQLQDAMVDTHFMLGLARVAIATDPDLLYALSTLIQDMGGEVVTAVTSSRAPILDDLPLKTVKLGDLEDLELQVRTQGANLLMSNSHAVDIAQRLGLPLLRVGFPQYDLIGGYQRLWIGYRGTRQLLFDLANLLLSQRHEIPAYRSRYAF